MKLISTIAAGLAVAALSAAPALAADLKASLTGQGSGSATVKVDTAKNEVCYDLTLTGVADPTAAHIHKAAAGANGPVAVPFSSPASGSAKGCATVAADVAADLVANPANYYVNVHSKTAPGGAVRGQLSK